MMRTLRKRGDVIVRNGQVLRFIEEEAEGEKWEIVGALSAPEQDDGWLSIESAPRDGTEILICFDGDEARQVIIARWNPHSTLPGDFGRFVWESQAGEAGIAEKCVSYWRPLPSPPVTP